MECLFTCAIGLALPNTVLYGKTSKKRKTRFINYMEYVLAIAILVLTFLFTLAVNLVGSSFSSRKF